MEFTSPEGEQKYDAFVHAARRGVVGLDFDGTLAPIVDDPEQAHIHPEAGDVLVDLAAEIAAVAVITGRPARQALDLGGLEEVGNAIGDTGKELYLFGQYGNERWSSTRRRIISPRPPAGLATFLRDLPRTPGWRTRGLPMPSTRAGWTTPTARSSGCCRRCASWPRATAWSSSPVGT